MQKRKILLPTLLVIDLLLTVALIVFLVLTHPGAELSLKGEAEEIEYTLYIGLNDKDTATQKITTEDARAIVDEICLKHVGGFTSLEAQGGWTDDEGVIVRENTLVYVFYGADEAQITAVMDEVLIALNQSSVLMRKETVQTTYYSGGE